MVPVPRSCLTTRKTTRLPACSAFALGLLCSLLLGSCSGTVGSGPGDDAETDGDDLGPCSALTVTSVSASSSEPGYPATNVIDGTRATRWVAAGVGVTLIADLGAVRNVCAVNIAWYQGESRTYSFSLDLSLDGVAFANAFTGQSSGTTSGLQTYDVPDAGTRYLRLTVNGSDVSEVAAVTELRVRGSAIATTAAAFSFTPTSPTAGQPVQFDASASACAVAPCTYTWTDEPSGGEVYPLGTGQVFNFTFQNAGTKYVNLVVADASGTSARVERDVVVADGPLPSDSTAPSVAISTPAAGTTVSGTVSVTGTASDNVELSKVEVQVDSGVFAAATGTSSWSYSWNTSALPDGMHTLTARATDSSGNTQTASVSVTVSHAPPSSQFPDATNTGVPAGTTLTKYTGPCTWRSGTAATLDRVDATACGALVTYVPGLKITNSLVPRLETEENGTVDISDSTVQAGEWIEGALWGSNLTATRVNISGGQHSFHCSSNCVLTDSYLHDQYNPSGGSTHNNAFLTNGGSNMTIRHNTLHCTPQLNSTGGGCTGDAVLLGDFDVVSHIIVENNLLKANNSSISYCAYGGYEPSKAHPIPDNITFKDNVFERGPNGKCGAYGAITSWYWSSTNVWSNNTWNDGTVLNP